MWIYGFESNFSFGSRIPWQTLSLPSGGVLSHFSSTAFPHFRLFKSTRIPFKFSHLLYFRSKNFVFYFNLTVVWQFQSIGESSGALSAPFFKILTLSRKSRFHFVQDTAHCWFLSTVSFRPGRSSFFRVLRMCFNNLHTLVVYMIICNITHYHMT